MEKKISKNQKMYPHRFGCSQNHQKAPQWGHFVILDVCECVILRPQIMLRVFLLLQPILKTHQNVCQIIEKNIDSFNIQPLS